MLNVDKKILNYFNNDIKYPSTENICAMIFDAVKNNKTNSFDYQNIIGYINQRAFSEKLLNSSIEKVYKKWWNEFILSDYFCKDKYRAEYFKELFIDPHFAPDSKKLYSYRTIFNAFERSIFFSGKTPIYYQSTYFIHFLLQNLNTDQSKPFSFASINSRCYLEIESQNIPFLTKKFVDYCLNNKLYIPFKVALTKRNDSFVFYCTNETLLPVIEMIEKTKQKYPSFFKNCKVTNPFLASYKNYIGFGSEPLYSSYNGIRSDILTQTVKELLKHYNKDRSYLNKQNILNTFKNNCKKNYIDYQNFCLNKKYEEEMLKL